jgi:hypothetical protein
MWRSDIRRGGRTGSGISLICLSKEKRIKEALALLLTALLLGFRCDKKRLLLHPLITIVHEDRPDPNIVGFRFLTALSTPNLSPSE